MDQHHSSRLGRDGLARRIAPRELRHPNSVTAPPLNRGSMVPQPWRGFWNSIFTAALSRLVRGHEAATSQRQPWQDGAAHRRLAFALLTVASAGGATALFAAAQPDYGNAWLEWGQIALFATLSTWVVTGFVTALMGFYVSLRGDVRALSARGVRGHAMNPQARTAIIMPICNEDVATVFAGLRATCESVAATGHARAFDVFVLSDTSRPEVAAA